MQSETPEQTPNREGSSLMGEKKYREAIKNWDIKRDILAEYILYKTKELS